MNQDISVTCFLRMNMGVKSVKYVGVVLFWVRLRTPYIPTVEFHPFLHNLTIFHSPRISKYGTFYFSQIFFLLFLFVHLYSYELPNPKLWGMFPAEESILAP